MFRRIYRVSRPSSAEREKSGPRHGGRDPLRTARANFLCALRGWSPQWTAKLWKPKIRPCRGPNLLRTNQKGGGRALFGTLRQQRNHAARRHTCQPRGKGQMVSSRPSSSTAVVSRKYFFCCSVSSHPWLPVLRVNLVLRPRAGIVQAVHAAGGTHRGSVHTGIPLHTYQKGLSVPVDVSGHNANAFSLAAGTHRLLPERGFYSSSSHPAEQTGGCRSPSGSRFVPFYPFSAIRSLVSRSKAGL